MKIAHVIATFPPHIGGMGSVCWNEVYFLAEKGHEVTVFTLKYPNTRYDDTIYDFSVVRLSPFIKMGDAGWVPQLAKYLNNFDIIHLHYPFYGGAEWFCFCKIPFVLTYHMDARPGGWIKSIVQKGYDFVVPHFLLPAAKKVIVVDEEYFKTARFGHLVKSSNLVEIFNGVDVNLFKPMAVDLSDLDLEHLAGKKIILFVGNPIPLKRIDLLIEALKILDDKEVSLVVVGEGYKLGKYKQMAKDLGIAAQVNFVGACYNQEQLSDYYNIATCLVVPSDYESFSLVVAEAMSCQVPVIGSDIISIQHRINEGVDGLLFKQGSAKDLADKLKQLLSMPPAERKKMGERGRAKVVEKYNWENHVEKLESVYREVLKEASTEQ